MSATMMSIPADALHLRNMLFDLSKPVTISPKEFDTVWPYIDSVYTKLQSELLQAYGTVRVQKYDIRDSYLCNVRMKVSRLVDGSAVTIERLDEHTHSHDIEESFRIKKPSILLEYIKSEAAKNYSAAQIYHAVRGAGTHELKVRAVGRAWWLVFKKRGMKSSDLRSLPHGKLFQDDVLQACELLMEREWLFEELQIIDSKKEQRWGLVFAHPTRLLILARRGWFTQFDATHKLNRWGHNMFSFLVRNEHNIWIPTAHLVVERENGEIIAEGLKHLKNGAVSIYLGKWQPRYIMTDDSAIEQRAIRLAFPGLNGGEQEAVAAATAIDNTGNMANYVQTYWLQTASKWAMYARQHSPFLLQATTTNACEAWHRKLKSGAGLSKGQVASHGIYGMILNIMDAAKDVDNRAVVAKSRYRNRKLTVCTKQYKEIGQLPVPIQKLLARELDAVEERIAKGKEVPNFDENLRCRCKFYRQYLLPCRHIFHLDTEAKVLTPLQWEAYIGMFAECGMEVYETVETVWIEEEGAGRMLRGQTLLFVYGKALSRCTAALYGI
ncbi:hypothetical protein BGX38DRAFT_1272784 [Terfezia claveryi]|nr:hypothetical protein BGX38DRAFT_1272784 [Terfezia claveryi]